jgi:hypothetical protein
MTDLTPNDLSHLSDEEFNALAPQGYHATGPAEPLSPAAQAVMDAFWKDLDFREDFTPANIAAALRAAADQVVPEHANPVGDAHDDARHDQWMRIRYKLLAIAAELDNTPATH